MALDLTHVNKMVALAKSKGFTVTSTTGGLHNSGSLHAKGLAVDVRVKDKTAAEVNSFIKFIQDSGYRVRDERVKPAGQKVWSGPHLHIEVKTILKKASDWAAANPGKAAGSGLVTLLVFFCSLSL